MKDSWDAKSEEFFQHWTPFTFCVASVKHHLRYFIHCSKILSDGLEYKEAVWAEGKNTDAAPFCSWWMAWFALQVHVQRCVVTKTPHSFVPYLQPPSIFHCCDAFLPSVALSFAAVITKLALSAIVSAPQVPDCLAGWWLAPCGTAWWALKLCRTKQSLVSLPCNPSPSLHWNQFLPPNN